MFIRSVMHENLSSIMKLVFGMLNSIVSVPRETFHDRTRTQHVPVTVVPTVQADKGLWGGEGVLIGYEDRSNANDF